MKESRNLVGREGLRPCPGENPRNLREEIGQKVSEGRMRRAKDVDEREENEKSLGGRGGEEDWRRGRRWREFRGEREELDASKTLQSCSAGGSIIINHHVIK